MARMGSTSETARSDFAYHPLGMVLDRDQRTAHTLLDLNDKSATVKLLICGECSGTNVALSTASVAPATAANSMTTATATATAVACNVKKPAASVSVLLPIMANTVTTTPMPKTFVNRKRCTWNRKLSSLLPPPSPSATKPSATSASSFALPSLSSSTTRSPYASYANVNQRDRAMCSFYAPNRALPLPATTIWPPQSRAFVQNGLTTKFSKTPNRNHFYFWTNNFVSVCLYVWLLSVAICSVAGAPIRPLQITVPKMDPCMPATATATGEENLIMQQQQHHSSSSSPSSSFHDQGHGLGLGLGQGQQQTFATLKTLLKAIITQARIELELTRQWRKDYAEKVWADDVDNLIRTWAKKQHAWLFPVGQQQPKLIGKNITELVHDRLLADNFLMKNITELLLDTYERFQRLSIGLKQVSTDHEQNQIAGDPAKMLLSEIIKKSALGVQKLLCEVSTPIFELRGNWQPNLDTAIIPPEFRDVNDATRKIRDWVIYREYINLLEFVEEAFQILVDRI